MALACAVFVALPVRAQTADEPPSRVQAFVEFGGSFYTDVSRSFTQVVPPGTPTQFREAAGFAKTGRLFTGARIRITPGNYAELSFWYSPGRTRSTIAGPPPLGGLEDTLRFHSDAASFNYVRTFASKDRVRPFLTGGIGFVAFNDRIVLTFKPMGNVGLGFDVPLSRRWALRVEQRIYFIGGAPRGVAATSKGTTLNFVPSAGLVLHF